MVGFPAAAIGFIDLTTIPGHQELAASRRGTTGGLTSSQVLKPHSQDVAEMAKGSKPLSTHHSLEEPALGSD